ncbi:hypothetical protein [Aureimonas sp. AU40]|uniref:hypothetical protein n=1 Tax=Aureimonas sp. AU40 TaxID=1637747 RepID=UPI0007829B8B|nr:hypothetical protein [Aureimonas sp. AU40]
MEGHGGAPNMQAPAVADAKEIRLATNQALRLAKMAGLEGVHAFHAASGHVLKLTGHDTMKAMGLTRLPAPEDAKPLIPTQIGERLGGFSAQAANKLLQAHGFQTKDERDDWQPTDKGREAGGHFILTSRTHSEGVAYQLVWMPSIVDILRPLLPDGGNVLPFPPSEAN